MSHEHWLRRLADHDGEWRRNAGQPAELRSGEEMPTESVYWMLDHGLAFSSNGCLFITDAGRERLEGLEEQAVG